MQQALGLSRLFKPVGGQGVRWASSESLGRGLSGRPCSIQQPAGSTAASSCCTFACPPARPPTLPPLLSSVWCAQGSTNQLADHKVAPAHPFIQVHVVQPPGSSADDDGRRGAAAVGTPSADPADAGILGSFIAHVAGADSSRGGGGGTAIEASPPSTASPPDTPIPDFGGGGGGRGDAPWRSLARAESGAEQSDSEGGSGPSGGAGAAPPSPPVPSGNGLAERDERALASSAEAELDPARTPFHQCALIPPLPPHTRACALAHAGAHVHAHMCCRLPIISPYTWHLGAH